MKVMDYIVLALFCIIVLFSFYFSYSQIGAASYVRIKVIDKEYLYDLNKDRDLVLKGALGDAYIKIKNSTVDVIKDPSPKQICVNQKPIHKAGEWLICLPNKISIFIIGSKDSDEVDALVN